MSLHLHTALEPQALRLRVGRVCLGAFVIAASLWALAEGPRLRAAADERMAAGIAAEDRDSCARLGSPPGTARFALCATELHAIRQHHEERVIASLSGGF